MYAPSLNMFSPNLIETRFLDNPGIILLNVPHVIAIMTILEELGRTYVSATKRNLQDLEGQGDISLAKRDKKDCLLFLQDSGGASQLIQMVNGEPVPWAPKTEATVNRGPILWTPREGSQHDRDDGGRGRRNGDCWHPDMAAQPAQPVLEIIPTTTAIRIILWTPGFLSTHHVTHQISQTNPRWVLTHCSAVATMPPSLSPDLKERIVKWYFEDGLTYRDIRDQGRVSLSVISTTICNYREFGQVKNPFRHYTGWPSYLDDEDMAFIKSTLTANPSIYLDELQKRLYDTRDLDISIATLLCTLKSAQISWKSLTKASVERDEELCSMWEIAMAEYTNPDVFVSLDESAINNRTVQRSHEWSPVGQPCVHRMTFPHGQRYSILPALTTDGIIVLQIFEGSITKEKFLPFLRTYIVSELEVMIDSVLPLTQAPKLNPYPGNYSVVVMDNCSIHHDKDIRRLIVDECGESFLIPHLYITDLA